MIVRRLTASRNLHAARDAFLKDLEAWIVSCIEKYADAPATDVHDQATYTTGWIPYIAATGDRRVIEYLKSQSRGIRDHFVRTGQWVHGYWAEQEAHHGTEHFGLFLTMMHRIDPEDADTKQQFLDAAEHIGDWVGGFPSWYDTGTGLFRSMHLGTSLVRFDPGMDLNIPDHLRFVSLCLTAFSMGGGDRYFDFAARYARVWATAILDRSSLPIGLLPDGPVYEMAGALDSAYRVVAGMAGPLDDDADRAENLLASDAIGIFLQLWEKTRDSVFVRAAERLLDTLIDALRDPDAGAVADAVRRYRRATGDNRYDQAILYAVDQIDVDGIRELGIEPKVQRAVRPRGVGKRADAPLWFENGVPRTCNPILLSVAAEIRQDEDLALRALDIARAYFGLAREVFPDGRDHGCAADTVNAIARGHGRENGAGMTTAVLGS